MKVKVDPIKMEVIKNALTSITEEMSATLYRSAYSTNIKTRKDYSCALFDKKLRLLAQSFSVPSHLGVIYRFVPEVINGLGNENIEEGDVLICNDPYHGAAHLNDIAMITPVFYEKEKIGYVINMAHHVDVGGGAPASFVISKELYQEGIIIPPLKLYSKGCLNESLLSFLIRNVRAKKEVRGDIRAQVAANKTGILRNQELISRYGVEEIDLYTDEILNYTAKRTIQDFNKLPFGEYCAEDYMDDDGFTDKPIRIKAKIIIDEDGIKCDFAGSDPQRKSPVNATLSFTSTAVGFVSKCLINNDIPVNDGFYRYVKVEAPEGTVVNCTEPSGVVGGYEVAMRVVSVLFKALADVIPEKIAAASKGNMGHLGFGGFDPEKKKGFAFLETIGGGSGGRKGKDGMDGVHTDLTNTENAPIEEVEINYPVRILKYELIPDSDGAGKWRGGLGIRRDYKFLNKTGTTVTIFSDRAKIAPWGILGGKEGATADFVLNPDGDNPEKLKSKCNFEVSPADIVSFRTPGGGGYGNPLERSPEKVLKDVEEGKNSLKKAREDYGVFITDDGNIDYEKTSELRNNR